MGDLKHYIHFLFSLFILNYNYFQLIFKMLYGQIAFFVKIIGLQINILHH